MAYDGHLIVTFSNGVAVIDRNLDLLSKKFYRFGNGEYVSNSIAVDEDGGIYIASANVPLPDLPYRPGKMRKLVWTGSGISDSPDDGAWQCAYEGSAVLPPMIKMGYGTGSTPTLMWFGENEDRLVVITDGAERMNLLAFWRDEIPAGGERLAGRISVTCGFDELPEWLQSEQSVVVSGYGAFVVNNLPGTVDPDLPGKNKILQVALMGPAYPTSYGVERFEWDAEKDEWSSLWARPDVSSTSMIPVHSHSTGMVLSTGIHPERLGNYGSGLEHGRTVHQTIFGRSNHGNGAYAILQYSRTASFSQCLQRSHARSIRNRRKRRLHGRRKLLPVRSRTSCPLVLLAAGRKK